MRYLKKTFDAFTTDISREFDKFDIEEITSYFHILTDSNVDVDLYYGFGSEELTQIRPNSMVPVSGDKKFPDIRSFGGDCTTPIIFAYVSLRNTKWNEFTKIADLYNGLAEIEGRLAENYTFKINKSDTKLFDFMIIIKLKWMISKQPTSP